MLDSLIDQLARARGIGDAYHNYRGELKYFSTGTKAAILAAMGCEVGDADGVQRELERIERARWASLLPPVAIVRHAPRTVAINVPADRLDANLAWAIALADGTRREGDVRAGELQELERHDLSGRAWRRSG